MNDFNTEAKKLAEMQNEYTLLTSKKPSEMCHEDFIRAEELNLEIKDATKVMAALAIELAGYKKDEKIKNNRLALLSAVKDVTHAVGDLNAIVQ